jgi:hypothetical protein
MSSLNPFSDVSNVIEGTFDSDREDAVCFISENHVTLEI